LVAGTKCYAIVPTNAVPPISTALSAKVSASKLHTERATKRVTSLNNPSLNHNLTYCDIQGIQKLANLFQLCWRICDKN
ncbi:hypothetical protein L2E46_25615, partial [Salmonella enterica subsp. enterica serovar Weltevreden]|uniref:hypothetical protein n=1 Tax=Salmonella enterica TaxID=28901 RepID=UPI001F20AD61